MNKYEHFKYTCQYCGNLSVHTGANGMFNKNNKKEKMRCLIRDCKFQYDEDTSVKDLAEHAIKQNLYIDEDNNNDNKDNNNESYKVLINKQNKNSYLAFDINYYSKIARTAKHNKIRKSSIKKCLILTLLNNNTNKEFTELKKIINKLYKLHDISLWNNNNNNNNKDFILIQLFKYKIGHSNEYRDKIIHGSNKNKEELIFNAFKKTQYAFSGSIIVSPDKFRNNSINNFIPYILQTLELKNNQHYVRDYNLNIK